MTKAGDHVVSHVNVQSLYWASEANTVYQQYLNNKQKLLESLSEICKTVKSWLQPSKYLTKKGYQYTVRELRASRQFIVPLPHSTLSPKGLVMVFKIACIPCVVPHTWRSTQDLFLNCGLLFWPVYVLPEELTQRAWLFFTQLWNVSGQRNT